MVRKVRQSIVGGIVGVYNGLAQVELSASGSC